MRMTNNLLITGGCGFVGSAFIRYLLRLKQPIRIVNLDLLTYAADQSNLDGFHENPRYRFIQGDINNVLLVDQLLSEYEIDVVIHFAAETQSGRSISTIPFLETNVFGTVALLEAIRRHPEVHFHHISTDEVYGSLDDSGSFTENTRYRPSSPYAASKASSDHFVRSYGNTYDLSTTISHSAKIYGLGQNQEQLIPHIVSNCLSWKPIPVYGNGANIRDWVYVDDHAEAIWQIIQLGRKGETYDIGGDSQKSNLDLIHLLIELIAEETKQNAENYRKLIRFTSDHPGVDFRAAIDFSKIKRDLNWHPKTKLIEGLKKTIRTILRKQIFV